jgi:serine/threonine-protein kinase
MAPEQATGKPDRRSDIFAVGVMLWEAIAKQRFVEKGVDEVVALTRRITGTDRLIREIVPDAPPELADICDKAMALDPAHRFATGAEMRDALEGYLRKGEPADARRVAALLEQNFTDERARIRGLVDDQVKRADDTGPMIDLQTQATVTPPSFGGAIDVPVDFTGVASPKVRAKRRLSLAFGGLAASLLAVGAAIALTRGHTPEAETGVRSSLPSAASSAERSPTASASAPATPAAPVTVTVAIHTTPATATLLVDGEAVSNPYRLDVPKDGSRHTIQISARGHATETRTIYYDNPQDLVVTLKPASAIFVPRPTSTTEVDLNNLKTKRPKRTVDEQDPYQ